MKSFREWQQLKGWKAEKAQAIQHWNRLPPGRPMAQLRVLPKDHKGSTHTYDGLRIMGSAAFIDSVLSRLKDLLSYGGNGTHLQVIYKQQVDKNTQQPIPESYVFYLQVKEGVANDRGRSHGQQI